MSVDKNLPDFEEFLHDKDTNNMIETLIKDNAFSLEFLASCVAHYYITILKMGRPHEN